VVTAGDNSTKSYRVTVNVAASTAKDITAFSMNLFLEVLDPARHSLVDRVSEHRDDELDGDREHCRS
jgi:hypothetical protein